MYQDNEYIDILHAGSPTANLEQRLLYVNQRVDQPLNRMNVREEEMSWNRHSRKELLNKMKHSSLDRESHHKLPPSPLRSATLSPLRKSRKTHPGEWGIDEGMDPVFKSSN